MITGGGSGIGRATALLFGQEAARVAVIDCNEPSARETASLIEQQRGEALPLVADVSNNCDVKNAVEAIVGRYGRLIFCLPALRPRSRSRWLTQPRRSGTTFIPST